jgi:general secretion pathway protein N
VNVARQRLPTLLIAAFAFWTLLVLAAVYTGLGGRYSLHPDDASRVPELPVADLSRAQNPLQSLSDYAVVGERPLFNADRRPLPAPEGEAGDAEAAPVAIPLDIELTSVIISGEMKLAIVLDKKANTSQSVRVGSSLEGDQAGWTLTELTARKAVFDGPTGRNEVDLRVFDGTGGQAPTAVASSAGAAPEASNDDASDGNQEAAQTPEARAELIRRRIE